MPRQSPFPPVPIDDALIIAQTIWQHNAGNPMRRITIFQTIGREPGSSTSRSLITASRGFQLTEGNFNSEQIKLTPLGLAVVSEQDEQSRLKAALSVEVFRSFFDRYKNSVVPNENAAIDYLKSIDIPESSAPKCLEVLLMTGRQVGLISEINGKERVLAREHVLENIEKRRSNDQGQSMPSDLSGRMSVTPDQSRESPTASGAHQTSGVPALHIDVQIHISSDAKPEQIEQVFASMAKHLYNRGD